MEQEWKGDSPSGGKRFKVLRPQLLFCKHTCYHRWDDTIITRFASSLKACRAQRDRRGHWEDIFEVKSLLCWNKSRQRWITLTQQQKDATSHKKSHQTSYEEGAEGASTWRDKLLFQLSQLLLCFTIAAPFQIDCWISFSANTWYNDGSLHFKSKYLYIAVSHVISCDAVLSFRRAGKDEIRRRSSLLS